MHTRIVPSARQLRCGNSLAGNLPDQSPAFRQVSRGHAGNCDMASRRTGSTPALDQSRQRNSSTSCESVSGLSIPPYDKCCRIRCQYRLWAGASSGRMYIRRFAIMRFSGFSPLQSLCAALSNLLVSPLPCATELRQECIRRGFGCQALRPDANVACRSNSVRTYPGYRG